MKKASSNQLKWTNNNNNLVNGDVRKGRSSPTDSGIDTQEWEEAHKGPRMSLDPYNYGGESEWSRVGNRDRAKGSPASDKRKNVPNGAPRPSSKGTGRAASQYIAKTNFLLEHLASFTSKTVRDLQITPQARLNETKKMLANGTLWTKDMEMRLTDNDVVLLDGETQDVIEVYPLSSIGQVQAISDDRDLSSVLVFCTMQTEHKYAAMHLFQSERLPATVVATEIAKASSSKEAMRHSYTGKMGGVLPPPPSQPAPQPPKDVIQDRMDLHEKSLVAQTIAAFTAASAEKEKKRVSGKHPVTEADAAEESIPIEQLELRINRDVQILNHCIDDIEQLVLRIKASAEAWKKLQKKRRVKADHPLMLEAKPPPETDLIDAYQKFKYAFILLGKLRPHLHKPNASELVHYLFVPLAFLIRVTNGPDKACNVLSPLLTTHAVELLQNCLSSQESDLWKTLGPKWTQTKHSKNFKDLFVPPYAPVFKDGWVPPGIGGKDVSNLSAAVAANAAAVAQLKDGQWKSDEQGSQQFSPSVLAAAAKFKRLASVDKSEVSKDSSSGKIFKRVKVMYDFTARNSRELSVRKGEELTVVDDSRQWWCVRNANGTIGFVPHTIVGEGHRIDDEFAGPIPSPPSTPPPQVPAVHMASVHATRSSPPKEAPPAAHGSRIPPVELRHVPTRRTSAEEARRRSNPREGLFIPPPPTTAPPATPPPTTPPPVTPPPRVAPPSPRIEHNTHVKAAAPEADFAQAIRSKNLRKVDQEAEKKKKDEAQSKRMSSADLLNDELKRRMVNGQTGGLTPGVQRKVEIKGPALNLNSDSSSAEVKEWLLSRGFSESCVAALSRHSAEDLERLSKDDFKRLCGESEGARVFSQISVQKANWETKVKGSELQFIMQRRKERVDDKQVTEADGDFNLRHVVAEARVAAAQEETIAKQERASSVKTGKQGPAPGPPATKAKSVRAREPNRPVSGSFSTSEFIPPPPVLDREANDTEGSQGAPLATDTADKIIEEQRRQQHLLMEHQKQLALLERLEKQKLELDQQKRDFERQQQRQQQTALLEKQKELERQIQTQHQQLKENEDRLQKQKLMMNNYALMQSQFAGYPAVSPQVPMIPMSGIPAAAPAYLPSVGGMQSIYGRYPGAMVQTGMPQMVSGALTMPTTVDTSGPTTDVRL